MPKARMTPEQMKAAHKSGEMSAWEILADLISANVEFPDAEWRVTRALGLDRQEVSEMISAYDNNI